MAETQLFGVMQRQFARVHAIDIDAVRALSISFCSQE